MFRTVIQLLNKFRNGLEISCVIQYELYKEKIEFHISYEYSVGPHPLVMNYKLLQTITFPEHTL